MKQRKLPAWYFTRNTISGVSVIPVLIDPLLLPGSLLPLLLPPSRTTTTTVVLFMSLLLLTPKLLKHHKNFSRENPFHLHYSIVQCGFSFNAFIVYWRCCQACDELIIPILMHATFSTRGGWRGAGARVEDKHVKICQLLTPPAYLLGPSYWLIRRLVEYYHSLITTTLYILTIQMQY